MPSLADPRINAPSRLPASVREMARNRPFLPGGTVSRPIGPFPLRCPDGRTFAERRAMELVA